MISYEESKVNYLKTKILEDLRKDKKHKITQGQMASFFLLKDRTTCREWELGKVIPSEQKYRDSFVKYLLDRLGLRTSPERFFQIWNELMVNEWEWTPLAKVDLVSFPYIADLLIPSTPTATLVPPLPVHKLFGRDVLFSALKKRLLNNSYVSFYGKPGVGKTDLALRLAHDNDIQAHFRDGILWVGLGKNIDTTSFTLEEGILSELGKWAIALGMSIGDLSKLTSINSRMEAMRRIIGRRYMLFIIDDAWQLAVAQNFIVGGPKCAYLLTTRIHRLAFEFANQDATEIVELDNVTGFELLKHQTQFLHQEIIQDVQTLVETVGGLPLALIIMGKYLNAQSYSRQRSHIQDALKKLRDVRERLHLAEAQSPAHIHPSLSPTASLSLHTAISISDAALDEKTQHTLRALAVFLPKPNTFSEEAILAVSNESSLTINALCEAGLLEVKGEGRYTLHQTIADYAKSNLTEVQTYNRMVTFFVQYAKTHQNDHNEIEREEKNILNALEVAFSQGLWDSLVQGSNAMHSFLSTRGLHKLANNYLSLAEKGARLLQDEVGLMYTLYNLGVTEYRQGNYANAQNYLKESLVVAKKFDILKEKSAILQMLGSIASNAGEPHQAHTLYQEALLLAQAVDDPIRIVGILQNIGVLADGQGNFEEAKNYYLKALQLAKSLGLEIKATSLLLNLGAIAYEISDYYEAENYFQQALAIAEKNKHHEARINALQNIGSLAGKRGNVGLERELYEQALALAYESGEHEDILYLLGNLGEQAIEEAQFSKANKYLQEGLRLASASGYQERINAFLERFALLEIKRGRLEQAESYWLQGLALARKLNHRRRLVNILMLGGELYLQRQQFSRAEDCLDECIVLATEVGMKEPLAEALYRLAQIKLKTGEKIKALQIANSSLEILNTIHHYKTEDIQRFINSLQLEIKSTP